VALEACEFWSAYCEAELDNAILRPFLPQVSLGALLVSQLLPFPITVATLSELGATPSIGLQWSHLVARQTVCPF